MSKCHIVGNHMPRLNYKCCGTRKDEVTWSGRAQHRMSHLNTQAKGVRAEGTLQAKENVGGSGME